MYQAHLIEFARFLQESFFCSKSTYAYVVAIAVVVGFVIPSGDAQTKIDNGNMGSACRSKIHEYSPSNVLMRLTHHQHIWHRTV